jgi:hypothetical protein
MPNQKGQAVEMTGRGKRGKPNPGFPLFPPPLEIAARFPHSHRLDDEPLVPDPNHRHQTLERSPYLVPVISPSFRLIFQLENAVVVAAGTASRSIQEKHPL